MPHQARRPVGILLDLHDVLERRIGRLVRVEQEIGRHHDGGQHIVEIVSDAAGELADQFHFLRLRDLGLELALRRGLERVDDGRFLVALGLFDRGDIETAEALARPGQHRIDRRDIGLAVRGGADGGVQRRPVALGDDGADRAVLAVGAAGAVKQPREQRIGADDAALLVDGRDRHRRVVEKPHEADVG